MKRRLAASSRLVDFVETVSGADRVTIARFFAKGMLMNVLAAMQYSIANERQRSPGSCAWLRDAGGRRMRALLFFSTS